MLHNISAAAKSSNGHTTTNNLSEAGEVRRDAQPALSALRAEPKACHHFVENEYHAMLCAEFSKRLEKTRLRQDAVNVTRYGFNDDAGEFRANFFKGDYESLDIIKR